MEPFYDYGYAKIKYNGDSGRLSGAGLKTIFSSKYFDASLTYSAALQKSNLITSTDKENKMLYFELSAKCC
jgi:hemolysin activation/secretion protein